MADDVTGTAIPSKFLSHDGKPGLERVSSTEKIQQVDAQLSFASSNGNALSANSTYNWNGTFTVPAADTYMLYRENLGCYASLMLDGNELVSNHQIRNRRCPFQYRRKLVKEEIGAKSRGFWVCVDFIGWREHGKSDAITDYAA